MIAPPVWHGLADILLLGGWCAVMAVFLLVTAGKLALLSRYPWWNSMWESGPLHVVAAMREGNPMYASWHDGPVNLAIYGPLFYQALRLVGSAADARSDELILWARWMGIGALTAGFIGVGAFVKAGGGRWWAVLIGTGCAAALLSPSALRFVVGARPDALAVALSVTGFVLATRRGPAPVLLGAGLMAAAWFCKATAVAAPVAATLALLRRPTPGRPRMVFWFVAAYVGLMAVTLTATGLATDGWFFYHLRVASSAPMRLEYVWHMLARKPTEPQVPYLFVLPALMILLLWLTRPRERPIERQRGGWTILDARMYLIVSLAFALLGALHQGSDRNYLIEPALAAGMLIGSGSACLGRARAGRTHGMTRLVAAGALLNPLMMTLPDHIPALGSPDTDALIEISNPYNQQAIVWLRSLPRPVLCLDSWLAYRAGVPTDLNDSIAYTSSYLPAGEDPIARRAREGAYACVVIPAGGAEATLPQYGDIPALWPGMQRVLAEDFQLAGQHGGWQAYTRKEDG